MKFRLSQEIQGIELTFIQESKGYVSGRHTRQPKSQQTLGFFPCSERISEKIPVGSASPIWVILECFLQVTFSRVTISVTQLPRHESAEGPMAWGWLTYLYGAKQAVKNEIEKEQSSCTRKDSAPLTVQFRHISLLDWRQHNSNTS